MIPKIFHRAWVGAREMPVAFKEYWMGWQLQHPGWEFRAWDDYDIEQFGLLNKAEYDAATSPAGKADIAMHEILHTHGGVWLCCDMECYKNIEPLIEGCSAFSGLQPQVAHVPSVLLGAIMGLTPKSEIGARLVAGVPESVRQNQGGSLWQVAGPGYLTRIVTAHLGLSLPELSNQDEFRVIDPKYVYPFMWTEPNQGREAYPEAYCCHHWAGSWL